MQLLRFIKGALYFPLAYYFRFFAQIRLGRWRPRIIVITGSSGKTTLLHLLESQLGDRARYSHGANSSYGIPFDILGLRRKTFTLDEWPLLFLKAPFSLFKSLPKEKLYVVEADCDRPGEGRFLGAFLKSEVTLWLNVSRTHSLNFNKQPGSIEKAVAHEFGYFIQYTSKLVVVNGDSDLIAGELNRTKAEVKQITKEVFQGYEVRKDGTGFRINGLIYSFNFLLPEKSFYGIAMVLELLKYLNIEPDVSFSRFQLPPGRASIFKGIKNTTLIDSTYNAPDHRAMEAVIDMFHRIPAKEKWAVLGDMVEQGELEKEEHQKLARVILNYQFDRVLLGGARVSKYTYPELHTLIPHFSPLVSPIIEKFSKPTEVLKYLQDNLESGETILFKGAGFLEGVVEQLLQDKREAKNLCRREKVWQKRRKQWGL